MFLPEQVFLKNFTKNHVKTFLNLGASSYKKSTAQEKSFKAKRHEPTALTHDEKLYKQAGLYYENRDFRSSFETLMQIKDHKTNPKYKRLYDELNQITAYRYMPHFSLALGNFTMHYMETGENWLFDHAILIYSNAYSSYQIGVNHAKRYGDDEVQQFIRLNPIKNDNISAFIEFRKSPEAILYPNRTYQYGALVKLGNVINGIFEGQFDRIRKTFLRRYIVGFEKYFGKYYFEFRPIYFVPKKGSNSLLYTYKLLKYYSADEFLGITVGTGKSPDLADLQTIGFFNLYNDYILLHGQKALTENLFVHLGVGYTKQRFPNDRERHFQNGLLGFKYRFT